MEVEQLVNPFITSGQSDLKRQKDVEDLWMSLLHNNANNVEPKTFGYDSLLQGMSLLLQTSYSHFKGTYCELQNVKTELNAVHKKLLSSLKKCEVLESASKNCNNCRKLEAQLTEISTRHHHFESVVMSAMRALNPPVNGGKQESKMQMKKALTIMTQALQGTQDMAMWNQDQQEWSPVRPGMQKRSLDDDDGSPNEIPGTPQPRPSPKRHAKLSLFQRPSRDDHLLAAHPELESIRVVVPETLDPPENMKENSWEIRESPLKCCPPEKADGRKVLGYLSSKFQRTPEKCGESAPNPNPNPNSPILGHSGKKSGSGKGTVCSREFSPHDMFDESPRMLRKSQQVPSPSLLCQGSFGSGVLGPQGGSLQAKATLVNTRKAEAKIVRLAKSGDISYERRQGVERKMKQQKLSLASFQRPKEDISCMKEFNGGLRAQTSDLAVELLEMDEEQQLQVAKRESLLQEENRKAQLALAAKWCGDAIDATLFMERIPGESEGGSGSRVAEFADDEVIPPSPEATLQTSPKDRNLSPKYEVNTLTFDPKISSTAQIVLKEQEDMSMSTFAPNLCSTAANIKETESENVNLNELIEEMAKPDDPTFIPRFETSFDRLPSKKDDSPDFKYRRYAVRKKSERQQLEGWDCHECQEYYKMTGLDPKKTMNKCSRHRDKFAPPTSTPPGFWDPGFPSTLSLRDRNQ